LEVFCQQIWQKQPKYSQNDDFLIELFLLPPSRLYAILVLLQEIHKPAYTVYHPKQEGKNPPVSTPTPDEQPPLSMRAFADSLYHGERADNFFKFLKNFPETEVADVLQELLREVGDAIDTGDTAQLARFVQQAQVRAYAPPPGTIQRPAQMLQLAEPAPLPQATLSKPLGEARVALFTTGAAALTSQEPFYPAEWSYDEAVRHARTFIQRDPTLKLIPRETPDEALRVDHIAYDLRAAQRDINVIFPLARLRELADDDEIGDLAPNAYSFHGLTNVPRLRDVYAPEWAQQLLQEGIDAVVLTPG
jgi:D-proline reductase (dithiol) PrdB